MAMNVCKEVCIQGFLTEISLGLDNKPTSLGLGKDHGFGKKKPFLA